MSAIPRLRNLLGASRGLQPWNATVVLRQFSAGATPAETEIEQKILKDLPAKEAEVKDTSGGCGTMYNINVVSDAFKGLSIVKQHQLVAKVLKDDIPRWHGFVLNTSAPKE